MYLVWHKCVKLTRTIASLHCVACSSGIHIISIRLLMMLFVVTGRTKWQTINSPNLLHKMVIERNKPAEKSRIKRIIVVFSFLWIRPAPLRSVTGISKILRILVVEFGMTEIGRRPKIACFKRRRNYFIPIFFWTTIAAATLMGRYLLFWTEKHYSRNIVVLCQTKMLLQHYRIRVKFRDRWFDFTSGSG